MVRTILKARSKSDQITTIVRRILQGTLTSVSLWVVYRYCWIDVSDPFKCGSLLHKGEWLDAGSRWSSPKPFQNWQPPGCMMHEYQKKDIHECFRNRRVVFIGDSTIRQIFWAVAKKMDQEKAEEKIADVLAHDEKHEDLIFKDFGVSIQFIWDPFLNSTGLDRELKRFSVVSSLEPTGASGESAALILLGAPGLWYARHDQENFMRNFRDSIEHVIPYMDHTHDGEDNLPPRSFNARRPSPNLLLLAPIQVPQYELLSPSRAATITPEKIDQMNDFLQQASAYSEADIVWSYNLMTWNGYAQYEESGLHVVENVARGKADILLNLRCNAGSASSKYPFDRTCCSNYTQPNHIQWTLIFVGMLLLPTLLWLRRGHVVMLSRFLPSTHLLRALTIFCLVICFCYYTDRTQIFEKAQKQFRQKEFVAACLSVGIAGLISIRKIKNPFLVSRDSITFQDQPFLSRVQTEEWKGWMQFIILIYHYTHGSKTLWIYEIIRLLIASYLFMTGFGHTTYFLRTSDYSLKRTASVLIRLNLLSCALPYMMRTDYMFYYFGSLVSFWFLVIYFTLSICHRRNSELPFLIGKVALSAVLVTSFIKMPGILEFIAFLLNKTCAISCNVKEWRFRTSLDLYITYIGMLVAAFAIRRTQLKSEIATPGTFMDRLIHSSITYRSRFNAMAVAISMGLLPGFWTLTRRSPNKEDYNWWHPYISFVPILCFVTLRNCHRLLRNRHSAAFAWLGRCSLETYILQYHVWLAGDTKGLLSLGLGGRWVNVAILTPLFLWISGHTAEATAALTGWIVEDSKSDHMMDEDIVGEKHSPHLIHKAQDPSPEGLTLGHQQTGMAMLLKRAAGKVHNGLRWRLGLVLLLMWLANVTYRKLENSLSHLHNY